MYLGPSARCLQEMSTIPDSQWEAHRETITALYCEQNKTLTDVMEIMRRKHNFNARCVSGILPALYNLDGFLYS